MKRRDYLSGLTALGALSATGQVGADSDVRSLSMSSAVDDDTYHPGPPRFGRVGQTFYDMLITDFDNNHAGGKDRDNFSPRIKGTPQQDAENYSGDDFSWSLETSPDDSSAEIVYAPPDGDVEQYDSGAHNVAEFAPDVPGTYVLELDAPDGTHEQLLHIFPEHGNTGGPPRISIDGHYDSDAGEFVLESNPKLAPNSPKTESDLFVAWLADGRDALSTDDIEVGEGRESWTARIPESALEGETGRVHAAPSDTNAHGYTDTVVLDPEDDVVEYPNRPPEWIQNGIMYEIFPRSFMGPPEESEWPLTNSNANFKNFQAKLDYLEEMNVDVIWFTPVVPSESGNWKPQNWQEFPDRFKYVGGGPHGYDALSYYQIAEDLGSGVPFEEYKDAPWPWEEGYDPETNAREQARQNAVEEFQAFLDAAHERDIKVCLDFVINHGGRHHPFFQDTIASEGDFRPSGWSYTNIEANDESSKYFDWFARKESAISSDGDVVDPAPAATGFSGLRVMPQWNYGNVALREHILSAAEHWAEMGVDAFRCDIAYGVPHSFWKEVREAVRDKNSEFMMLDETIPNDPNFAENEFDMHFDTADFMASAGHSVVNGGDPMKLFDAVAKRDKEGWPEHTLITNATENHDEQRLFKLARDGSREDPAKAQRAVWAAGVALPGVPFIYYGQERLVTKYGQNRFDFDGEGTDPRSGDVGSGNYKRAFMNWEDDGATVPQDHLQFYQDVTAFYQESDVLKPDADLKGAWFQSKDSVLVFGRSLETDDGEQNAIVMVHFDPGTATVDLLPGASTTDLFSGEDIGTDSSGDAVTVEFDTLAVVETDSLFSIGESVAQLTEESGDDNGPGSYTYPTGDAYADGVFDMTSFSVHATADTYQFRVGVDGDLTNPEGYDSGISAQHLQLYLQNPDADNGATAGRAGTNVTFEAPYQYRVVADGENGVRVEDHEGTQVAEGSLMANPVADEIVVEMPKSAIDTGIRSHYVAPLLFGYDSDADGGVMAVQSEAGASAFGGADDPGNAPRVIDMVVPETGSQAEALSYSGEAKATLPYTSLATEFAQVGAATDPSGDDDGPGNYQYPSAPEDAYYEGAWDVTGVQVYESRSRVRFEYTMATEVQNPWGLEGGFSQQFIQVYVRDPDADGDVPASRSAREGVNAGFAEPYHYRIAVHGQGLQQVENGAGDTVTTDVNVAVDGKTIAVDLPLEAIGGSPQDKQLAALMVPFDGYGTGSVRQAFAGQPGEHTVGTSGQGGKNAPHVMDMITPEGTSQAQALAYSGSSKAQIPFAAFQSTYVQTEGLGAISDPTGDDYGPGGYTYPTSDQIPEGCFDVTEVEVTSNTQNWEFTVHIDGPVTNPWDYSDGFSQQLFQFYLQDPNAPDDAPSASKGRSGMISTFQEAYHYRIYVDGGSQMVENANGDTLAEDFETTADPDASTISFKVPKAPFDTDSFSEMKTAMLVFSQDGYGTGGIRQNISSEAGQWAIGGGDPNALSNAPRVLELIAPDAVVDQKKALSYAADAKPSIPLVKAEYLLEGEKPQTDAPSAVVTPGPTVFSGMEGTLDASNSSDPDGQDLSFEWSQTGGPDATELSGAQSAQLTFTAPEVDEEATLQFEVTVTDPDGNSATGTTSATVKPQSANDAPVAEAALNAGYSQPIAAGETVSINGYDSEDPNGGSLSYEWTQVGGQSVELNGVDSGGAFFIAPEVDEETTLEFELTVHDGQGKSATDTLEITIAASGGSGTPTPTPDSTTTSSGPTTTEGDTGGATTSSGDGPGFGVASGLLGSVGGAAYAAKRLLSEDSGVREIDVEDVEDDED